MEKGKIIKGIAGFYYVHTAESGTWACKAKGIFRKKNIKPLVGDDVEFEITDPVDREGNIMKILPRRNALIRPAAANVDQALVIFAVTQPEPNLNLLDRFLVSMEKMQVESVVCFNKSDLGCSLKSKGSPESKNDQKSELESGLKSGPDRRNARDNGIIEQLRETYRTAGYPLLFTSAAKKEGIDAVRSQLRGKTTVVAGPSGVGKSSLINLLSPDVKMETGEISKKIERGKNTTRHAQLIRLEENTYIMDTPGFTSLSIDEIEKEELAGLFPEFREYEGQCRFVGCSHVHEPDCAVKEALAEGKISKLRYEHYCAFYEELAQKRKY